MNTPSSGQSVNLHERALLYLMRFGGLLLLTALIPALMPFAWMDGIHRYLGMGELPDRPIVAYLTRSLSAMYAMHGALVLFVATDVRRYLPVVRCLGALAVVFGAGMIVLDVAAGMPTLWVIFEGPTVVLLGAAILWLARSVPPP